MDVCLHLAIEYRGANITVPGGINLPSIVIPPSGESLPAAVGTGGNSRRVSLITLLRICSFCKAEISKAVGIDWISFRICSW